MLKKLTFFISLSILINLTFLLYAEIIPLKKPTQTKEEEEKKLLVDVLKPLPKPIKKSISTYHYFNVRKLKRSKIWELNTVKNYLFINHNYKD